jgi:hypothetical protein
MFNGRFTSSPVAQKLSLDYGRVTVWAATRIDGTVRCGRVLRFRSSYDLGGQDDSAADLRVADSRQVIISMPGIGALLGAATGVLHIGAYQHGCGATRGLTGASEQGEVPGTTHIGGVPGTSQGRPLWSNSALVELPGGQCADHAGPPLRHQPVQRRRVFATVEPGVGGVDRVLVHCPGREQAEYH